MIALIRGLISAIVSIAAILFALGNRQTVSLAWSPVNDPVSVPLFVVGLGGLGIGFVVGALLIWVRSLGLKWHMRRQKRRIEALEKGLPATPEARPSSRRMGKASREPLPATAAGDPLLIEDLGAP